MTRDELLASLAVERQDQTWWSTPRAADTRADDDLAAARRRRLMAEDFDRAKKESA